MNSRFRPGGQDDLAPSGPKIRIRANIATIETVRALQAEGRPATADEQAVLARWSSWGAVPNIFDEDAADLAPERAKLRDLLTDDEWYAAVATTRSAHYTDASLVQPIWEALRKLGFERGRVLEPGCGSGNFIGFAPEGANVTGIELDPLTAKVAAALYPDATVRSESFVDTRLPEGYFDLVVGNVPFDEISPTDPIHNPLGLSLHNYFITKSLNLVRPGGLVAVLTSRYTLDAKGRPNRARAEIAAMADLVGAVRLPEGAHQRAAGTDVVTDLLLLRRREPGREPGGADFAELSSVDARGGPYAVVNSYFARNPRMVLGEHAITSGPFGSRQTVEPTAGTDLPAALTDALDLIVAEANQHGLRMSGVNDRQRAEVDGKAERMREARARFGSDMARFEGTILDNGDGTFSALHGGEIVAHPCPSTQVAELRALIGLRDAYVALIETETAATEHGHGEDQLDSLRATLNQRYDAYTTRFGLLNRVTVNKSGHKSRPGQGGFKHDPYAAGVYALEDFDFETGVGRKASIFTERGISPRIAPTSADTPEDAIAICLGEHGEVRLETIARLLGSADLEQTRRALGELVYDEPGTSRLVPAAEYLSGDVRGKLAEAEVAVLSDQDGRKYQANVAALREVLPEDRTPGEIDVRFGAPWISPKHYEEFLQEILNTPRVTVTRSVASNWKIEAPPGVRDSKAATEVYGTGYRDAINIAQRMLRGSALLVSPGTGEPGETPQMKRARRRAAARATEEVQTKADELNRQFVDWLWRDGSRTVELLRVYNKRFNSHVVREYDGSYLRLPGLSDRYTLRPHQLAAVARALTEPGAVFDHEVGFGKTLELIVTAMEMRRLGIARKPCIVVPNQVLAQFRADFLKAYPNARVLAGAEEDFKTPELRKRFVSRIANGDWDAVILSESVFERIPMSARGQERYIRDQTQDVREAIGRAAADGANRRFIKQMQGELDRLTERLKKAMVKASDSGIAWEQTGIDGILKDEFHRNSNLYTPTHNQELRLNASSRASDLEMKHHHTRRVYSPRALVGASGTPVPNSMVQSYVALRLYRPDLLEHQGVKDFDSFRGQYMRSETAVEVSVTGTVRVKERISSFDNRHDFARLWQTMADVKTSDDIKLDVPPLIGGGPETVIVPASDADRAFMASLDARMDQIQLGEVEPDEDNPLLVTNHGRMYALDPRMMDLPFGPPGTNKTELAADRIHGIYQEHQNAVYKDLVTGEPLPVPGALQLVFADLGTPSPEARRDGKFIVYEALRDELVERGIPRERIRFIQDCKTSREKEELFKDCRSGKVSVIMGSTDSLGTGVNIQYFAVATHHLDGHWKPAGIGQRNGRVPRQGNQNTEGVRELRYIKEYSVDAYMWQTVQRKLRSLLQLRTGRDVGEDVETDLEKDYLTANELKAIASGNPLLMEKTAVDEKVRKLEASQTSWQRTRAHLSHVVSTADANLAAARRKVEAVETAIAQRIDTKGDAFRMRMRNGNTATTRNDAAEALRRQLAELRSQTRNRRETASPITTMGVLGGLTVTAVLDLRQDTAAFTIADLPDSKVFIGDLLDLLRAEKPPHGLIQRLENQLARLNEIHAAVSEQVDRLIIDVERAKDGLEKPFDQAAELSQARAEQGRLQAAIDNEAGAGTETYVPDESADVDPTDSAFADALAMTRTTQADHVTAGTNDDASDLIRSTIGDASPNVGAPAMPPPAAEPTGADENDRQGETAASTTPAQTTTEPSGPAPARDVPSTSPEVELPTGSPYRNMRALKQQMRTVVQVGNALGRVPAWKTAMASPPDRHRREKSLDRAHQRIKNMVATLEASAAAGDELCEAATDLVGQAQLIRDAPSTHGPVLAMVTELARVSSHFAADLQATRNTPRVWASIFPGAAPESTARTANASEPAQAPASPGQGTTEEADVSALESPSGSTQDAPESSNAPSADQQRPMTEMEESVASPVEPSLVIEHHHSGTLVKGTERGDRALIDLLKGHGFRWSGNIEAWYLRRGTSYDRRDRVVRELSGDLERAGRAFRLDAAAPPSASPTVEISPTVPYNNHIGVYADVSSVVSSYVRFAKTPAGKRLLGATGDARRPDAEELRIASMEAPGASRLKGLPIDAVAARHVRLAKAARTLADNLEAERYRAPAMREHLSALAQAAETLAGRLLATARDDRWESLFHEGSRAAMQGASAEQSAAAKPTSQPAPDTPTEIGDGPAAATSKSAPAAREQDPAAATDPDWQEKAQQRWVQLLSYSIRGDLRGLRGAHQADQQRFRMVWDESWRTAATLESLGEMWVVSASWAMGDEPGAQRAARRIQQEIQDRFGRRLDVQVRDSRLAEDLAAPLTGGVAAPAGVWSQKIKIRDDLVRPQVTGTEFQGDPPQIREALKANRFRWQKGAGGAEGHWEYGGAPANRAKAVAALRAVLAELDELAASETAKGKFPPTLQQKAIIDHIVSGKELRVLALAGTGKTSTMVAVAEALPGKKITYIAFNRTIADEARGKFRKGVTVVTSHGLAFRGLRAEGTYTDKLQHVRKGASSDADVARILGIQELKVGGGNPDDPLITYSPRELARWAMSTVKAFRESAATAIGPEHLPKGLLDRAPVGQRVLSYAQAAWADITNPGNAALLVPKRDGDRPAAIRFGDDDYLKIYALSRPKIDADLIIFDEAQDINPITAALVQSQSAQTVVVGDSHQSIYGFRGAVDAISTWPAPALPITKSWRFGPAVAELGNMFLRHLNADLVLEGNPDLDSRIVNEHNRPRTDAVLCRTNFGAINAIDAGLSAGRRVALAGGGNELIDVAKAAQTLKEGGRTRHPDFEQFETWQDVLDHVEQHPEDKGLATFVALIERKSPEGLLRLLGELIPEDAQDAAGDTKLVVSTAHKAKGREWPNVVIADDFRGPQTVTDEDGNETTVLPEPEELRLSYVTVTRAQNSLDLGSLAWIKDHPAQPQQPEPHVGTAADIDAVVEQAEHDSPEDEPEPVVTTEAPATTETVPAEVTPDAEKSFEYPELVIEHHADATIIHRVYEDAQLHTWLGNQGFSPLPDDPTCWDMPSRYTIGTRGRRLGVLLRLLTNNGRPASTIDHPYEPPSSDPETTPAKPADLPEAEYGRSSKPYQPVFQIHPFTHPSEIPAGFTSGALTVTSDQLFTVLLRLKGTVKYTPGRAVARWGLGDAAFAAVALTAQEARQAEISSEPEIPGERGDYLDESTIAAVQYLTARALDDASLLFAASQTTLPDFTYRVVGRWLLRQTQLDPSLPEVFKNHFSTRMKDQLDIMELVGFRVHETARLAEAPIPAADQEPMTAVEQAEDEVMRRLSEAGIDFTARHHAKNGPSLTVRHDGGIFLLTPAEAASRFLGATPAPDGEPDALFSLSPTPETPAEAPLLSVTPLRTADIARALRLMEPRLHRRLAANALGTNEQVERSSGTTASGGLSVSRDPKGVEIRIHERPETRSGRLTWKKVAAWLRPGVDPDTYRLLEAAALGESRFYRETGFAVIGERELSRAAERELMAIGATVRDSMISAAASFHETGRAVSKVQPTELAVLAQRVSDLVSVLPPQDERILPKPATDLVAGDVILLPRTERLLIVTGVEVRDGAVEVSGHHHDAVRQTVHVHHYEPGSDAPVLTLPGSLKELIQSEQSVGTPQDKIPGNTAPKRQTESIEAQELPTPAAPPEQDSEEAETVSGPSPEPLRPEDIARGLAELSIGDVVLLCAMASRTKASSRINRGGSLRGNLQVDWDRKGLTIEVYGRPAHREGKLTWKQAADWLRPGLHPERFQLLRDAYTADRRFVIAAGFDVLGQEDLRKQAEQELFGIAQKTKSAVLAEARAFHETGRVPDDEIVRDEVAEPEQRIRDLVSVLPPVGEHLLRKPVAELTAGDVVELPNWQGRPLIVTDVERLDGVARVSGYYPADRVPELRTYDYPEEGNAALFVLPGSLKQVMGVEPTQASEPEELFEEDRQRQYLDDYQNSLPPRNAEAEAAYSKWAAMDAEAEADEAQQDSNDGTDADAPLEEIDTPPAGEQPAADAAFGDLATVLNEISEDAALERDPDPEPVSGNAPPAVEASWEALNEVYWWNDGSQPTHGTYFDSPPPADITDGSTEQPTEPSEQAEREAQPAPDGLDELAPEMEEVAKLESWYRDTPQWQHIRQVWKATQTFFNAVKDAAKGYWKQVRADARSRGCLSIVAARAARSIAGAAGSLARLLEWAGQRDSRPWRATRRLHRSSADFADQLMGYLPAGRTLRSLQSVHTALSELRERSIAPLAFLGFPGRELNKVDQAITDLNGTSLGALGDHPALHTINTLWTKTRHTANVLSNSGKTLLADAQVLGHATAVWVRVCEIVSDGASGMLKRTDPGERDTLRWNALRVLRHAAEQYIAQARGELPFGTRVPLGTFDPPAPTVSPKIAPDPNDVKVAGAVDADLSEARMAVGFLAQMDARQLLQTKGAGASDVVRPLAQTVEAVEQVDR
ncbi:UvrD-helicase domain-containing protein [Actinomadura rayongensis]|uniref:AAA family ATPase n=1 Tax=Actinomadura rayongensis TaxID=1429076 RepID=A0A6I4W8Z1_9ACTN|nr:UvrD-helicase domain-containing protein [Actinomadura rayongensis]MXQ65643.1 AAA family ATPase [Actinomadura rayongensis]